MTEQATAERPMQGDLIEADADDRVVAERRPAPVVATGDAASILSAITAASTNPDVDVDKLERLMGMYRELKGESAEQAFFTAMQEAQAEMPQVVRDADNDQTKSKYARLETISAAMNPVITKHGFSMSFGTADSPHEKHYRITCLVAHREGHHREYHADVPIDAAGMKGQVNKTPTHAFGSTMSYGRRYLKLLIFDIATKLDDDDGNAAGNDVVTEEQVADIRAMIKEIGADEAKVAEYARVDAIEDIPARHFDKVMRALKERKRNTGSTKKGDADDVEQDPNTDTTGKPQGEGESLPPPQRNSDPAPKTSGGLDESASDEAPIVGFSGADADAIRNLLNALLASGAPTETFSTFVKNAGHPKGRLGKALMQVSMDHKRYYEDEITREALRAKVEKIIAGEAV